MRAKVVRIKYLSFSPKLLLSYEKVVCINLARLFAECL